MTEPTVSALDLCDAADQIFATCDYIVRHCQDSDDPQDVALLLAALRDQRQAIAETYATVEEYLVTCRPVAADRNGEAKPVKEIVVPGVGVVEFKRKTSRTGWRSDDLRAEIVRTCASRGVDVLDVLAECSSPSWKVTGLRALGIEPGDWCVEVDDGTQVVLPPRDIEMRGRTAEILSEAS